MIESISISKNILLCFSCRWYFYWLLIHGYFHLSFRPLFDLVCYLFNLWSSWDLLLIFFFHLFLLRLFFHFFLLLLNFFLDLFGFFIRSVRRVNSNALYFNLVWNRFLFGGDFRLHFNFYLVWNWLVSLYFLFFDLLFFLLLLFFYFLLFNRLSSFGDIGRPWIWFDW